MPFYWIRPKKTAEFLKDAVELRLRMLIPYIDTWPQVSATLKKDFSWHHFIMNQITLLADHRSVCLCALYWYKMMNVMTVSLGFTGYEHPATAPQHPRQPEAPDHDGGWHLVLRRRSLNRREWLLWSKINNPSSCPHSASFHSSSKAKEFASFLYHFGS